METEEEKRSSEEVITFIEVRDPSDPLNLNHKTNFSDLAINSPKDTTMLDDDDTKLNEKCQAKAADSPVKKSASGSNNNGSTKGHQAESIINEPASDTAKVYEQEEEKEESSSETGEEEDDEVTEVGEVEITKEVMGGGKEEEKKEGKEAGAKKSRTPGADLMASRDNRYREVIVEKKSTLS